VYEEAGEAMSDWEILKKEVLQELKPSYDEETQILTFAKKIVKQINYVLAESKLDAVAELHGSVAHGTWIKEQRELDVFIIFEEYSGRDKLNNALDVLKKKTDWVFTEAYAEHPYLRTAMNNYQLDIVPCFKVKGGKLHSSTDRTPLHTKWLLKRIKGLEDEVRILKKFLMNLDLYGAEIRIGGFSGYLCELLIIYYGSFWKLVKESSRWDKTTFISFTGDTSKKFNNPMVFIDPVDKGRNVASALREESYTEFIAAVRSFISNPSKVFFKPHTQQVSEETVLEELNNRPTDILFLVIEEKKADVPDVLWGQIHKSRQAIEQKITEQGFKVLRSTAWSNEKTRHIFIYELESRTIPKVIKHIGPPAHLENNVNEFIETYRDNPKTIAGPDLLIDRWFVLIKRDYNEIKQLLDNLLEDGGRFIGVSRKLSIRIIQRHRALLNEEIENYLIDGFEVYLYGWLKGRPLWIE
jgi:tRNA nucleotidyltransferase (CCA-adding enzyme)